MALTYRATVDAQAAEGDARGLAVVRPAARAAIAPPPAGAVQSLPEEALFPIEALEKLPPEATARHDLRALAIGLPCLRLPRDIPWADCIAGARPDRKDFGRGQG